MLVGIIDCDIFINKTYFVPNLEVTLLSAYHKQKGDIVQLLMNAKGIEMYDKIYIRRNKKGHNFKFPAELYSLPNVDIGGLYFTNGVQLPIKEEVFACNPDISVYDKFYDYWGDKPIRGVSAFQKSNFVSLRKGTGFDTPRKVTYIYDYDLGSKEDCDQLALRAKKGAFRTLHFAYPVVCEDLQTAIKWAKQPWIHKTTTQILYPHEVNYDDLGRLRKEKLLLPIRAYYTEQDRFYDNKDFERVLMDSINKTLYVKINEVPIKMLLSPKIRENDRTKLLKKVENWNVATVCTSFYESVKSNKALQRQLEDMEKRNPRIKDLIYINPIKFRKQGGIWLNDR